MNVVSDNLVITGSVSGKLTVSPLLPPISTHGLPVGSTALVADVCPRRCGNHPKSVPFNDVVRRTSFLCQCDFDATTSLDLTTIDTEVKAYLLGHLAEVVVINHASLECVIHTVWPGLPSIDNTQLTTELYDHLTTQVNKHLNTPGMVTQLSRTCQLAFIRGLFESVSWPGYKTRHHGLVSGDWFMGQVLPEHLTRSLGSISYAVQWVGILSHWTLVLHDIALVLGVKQDALLSKPSAGYLFWSGHAAVDVMALMYHMAHYYYPVAYKKYLRLCSFTPAPRTEEIPTIAVALTLPGAVLPSKTRASDSGYDLTVIKKVKQLTETTALYDTGVRVSPPSGYYLEVVPRSSLSKTGYMLANSVGVIDRTYRGNIFVAVARVDRTVDELKLPFCGFQLIPRQVPHLHVVQVDASDLDETDRGDGGFGSTDGLGIRGSLTGAVEEG